METSQEQSDEREQLANATSAELLLETAKSGSDEQLSQLVSNADIDVKNERGYTALHLAILEGNIPATEALLVLGANIEAKAGNQPDTDPPPPPAGDAAEPEIQGPTPLHEAVLSGHVEAARLLIDYGASLNAQNEEGREPLFLAVLKKDSDMVKLLLEKGGQGVDPNAFFAEDPPTAMHLAASNGDLSTMQALLDGGARVDTRDFEGATPLFQAVVGKHLEAARLLLQRGAHTRIWRVDGKTVFDLADGDADMLELLKSRFVLQGPRLRHSDNTPDLSQQASSTLKPAPSPALNDRDKMVTCHGFEALVTDFFTGGDHEQIIPKTTSIYDLLYSHGPSAIRSQLGDREPSFTWYHLPSNNMAWAEALIRRLAAETGNISLEMYNEARPELGFSKPAPPGRRIPMRTRPYTLRPNCRKVQHANSFTGSDDKEIVVSVLPYLSYEDYHNQMQSVMVTNLAAQHRRMGGVPPPPGWPYRRNRAGIASSSSSNTTTPPPGGLWKQAKGALSSLKAKFGTLNYPWKSKRSVASTGTKSDLENQSTTYPPPPAPLLPQPKAETGNHSTGLDAADQTIHGGVKNHIVPESKQNEAPRPPTLGRPEGLFRLPTKDATDYQQAATTARAPDKDKTASVVVSNPTEVPQDDRKPAAIPAPRRDTRLWVGRPHRNLHDHLIRGYHSFSSQLIYQPRRTLDQYGYGDIDTKAHNDDDQVIYRYTKRAFPAKIFMVDQLWMWILGNGTIITCCPLRWEAWINREPMRPWGRPAPPKGFQQHLFPGFLQPGQHQRQPEKKSRRSRHDRHKESWPEIIPDDPMNVAQRVMGHLFKQGRGAVGSVHDLAALITTCCVDLFDPHQVPEELQFFDFFERSIGKANDKVASHLKEFKEAITELRKGLREHDVMDITDETELMIEVEDILDELHTLKKVLKDQEVVIKDMNKTFSDVAGAQYTPDAINTRTLESHLLHIARMEESAGKADTSLHRLMDLKQKQASLTEAWYARESAKDTARQGKTVIVFTVVTIIFLPISFIATVFTIETDGFPLNSNDRIPFDYLMKYIMAIGLGLSVPLIIVAFNVDRIAFLVNKVRGFSKLLLDKNVILKALALASPGLFAAILAPLWTSDLSSTAKVATTIVVVLLALGLAVGLIINGDQFGLLDFSGTETSSSSSGSSSS